MNWVTEKMRNLKLHMALVKLKVELISLLLLKRFLRKMRGIF